MKIIAMPTLTSAQNTNPGKSMIIAADVSLQFSKLGYDVIGIHTRSEDTLKPLKTTARILL